MTRSQVQIAPSILTADFGHLAEQVRAADNGGADLWHLDVMDGHFVPPLSFGKEVVAAVRAATERFIEAHMMVAKPLEHFEDFAQAGAQRLIFHYEAVDHDEQAVRLHVTRIRELGCQAGIAINPETPAEALFPLLDAVDEALVMLIRPGWGGQPMQPELLDKVRSLRERIAAEGLDVPVEVDGGVKAHNAAECAVAGATILVAGSAVFNAEQTPEEALQAMRAALR